MDVVAKEIPYAVVVTSESALLYLGDSESYEAIGSLREGKVVDVAAVSIDTGWYAVRTPRYILWISDKDCEGLYESDTSGDNCGGCGDDYCDL